MQSIKKDLLEGRAGLASDACRRLLAAAEDHASLWHLYGLASVRLGKVSEAISAFRAALSLEPDQHRWWRDLGVMHLAEGELPQASLCFRRATDLVPDNADNLWNLGRSLFEQEQFQKSSKILLLCVSIDPNRSKAWELLGRCYNHINRPDKVAECLERCAALQPTNKDFAHWLAISYCQAGATLAALSAYDRAIQLDPGNASLASAKLAVLIHKAGLSSSFVRDEHKAWFEKYFAKPANLPRQKKDSDALLRVGYIGNEFVRSPSNHFLHPWLSRHDSASFEIFFYHVCPKSDFMTQVYQRLCSQWRDVSTLTDSELESQIRRDEIDILVDLTGHFDNVRLAVFARRVASVQVSYPNYPCTTGVAEIDYILTDRFTCAEGQEGQYVETPYFLPSGYITYEARKDAPPLSELPALTNGFVTFGVFQRPSKTHPEFWRTVSQVLQAVPESRLLISCAVGQLEAVADNFISRTIISELQALGISESRVQFRSICDAFDHMQLVAGCDIALDTFPYNGQTTTCECLWMGVPVVTVRGTYHTGMVATGILQRTGLSDWAAADLSDYVNIAQKAAQDLGALNLLRQSLRSKMLNSSLLNPDGFVREVESAYRWMYRQISNAERDGASYEKASC